VCVDFLHPSHAQRLDSRLHRGESPHRVTTSPPTTWQGERSTRSSERGRQKIRKMQINQVIACHLSAECLSDAAIHVFDYLKAIYSANALEYMDCHVVRLCLWLRRNSSQWHDCLHNEDVSIENRERDYRACARCLRTLHVINHVVANPPSRLRAMAT
jgi:hypothetical protein